MSRAEIADALTHTKLLPGSTVVQVVAYLAWRFAGCRGSAIATLAFLLPSALMMIALAVGYLHVAALPAFFVVLALPNASAVVVIVAGLIGIVSARRGRQ
jgi:chromate transporter